MELVALLVVESRGPMALAQVDILGASTLKRTVESLGAAGITQVAVVSAETPGETYLTPAKIQFVKSSAEQLWRDARSAFASLTVVRPEAVLLIKLNCYAEMDWKAFLAKHRAGKHPVTRAWASGVHALDMYLVDPRAEKEVEFLLHNQLRHPRLIATRYQVSGEEYVHPLLHAADLREIAVDGLNLECQMRPAGREVKPGVWLADGSRIDEGVRLVAPLFVGKRARVRTGAVITRGSSIEHHSLVDCGTVVENTSILPFSAVGAGLDFTHAVVGNRQVVDLKRNVAVEIHDSTLLAETAHNAGVRVMSKAAALVTYLPMQFFHALAQRNPLPKLAEGACANDFVSTVINEREPRGKETALPTRALPKLVMERYGNQ
ncbi:MAG TPA: hypothetical protein VMZ25_08830 [Terriglobales bacterium]|nr:hypothetical protein [Terriglobales bacterium]